MRWKPMRIRKVVLEILKEFENMKKIEYMALFICIVSITLLFGCTKNRYSDDPGYLKCMNENDYDHCMTSGGQSGCDPSSKDICLFHLASNNSDPSICDFINPDVPTDWPFTSYSELRVPYQSYSEFCRNIIAISMNESICRETTNPRLSVACSEYWQYR